MEFPGGGGSTARPSGTENPGGWGGQTGKTLRGGGMDIFWNHTFCLLLNTVISLFNLVVLCFLLGFRQLPVIMLKFQFQKIQEVNMLWKDCFLIST